VTFHREEKRHYGIAAAIAAAVAGSATSSLMSGAKGGGGGGGSTQMPGAGSITQGVGGSILKNATPQIAAQMASQGMKKMFGNQQTPPMPGQQPPTPQMPFPGGPGGPGFNPAAMTPDMANQSFAPGGQPTQPWIDYFNYTP
jgi:hypothetical protein